MGEAGLFDSWSDTWTYVLLTPDAVVGGALPFVLDRLEAHHLRPSVCRLVGLEVEKMQQFYGGTTFIITNPGSEDFQFSWSTHEGLYAVAPACLIMLSHERGSACETMLGCKGHVRPELAAPETIRRMGENVIFNLVHSPDDTASALRELDILFGAEEAEHLLHVCDALPGNSRVVGLTGVRSLFDALPAFHGPDATSFQAIAQRIRRRVIMRLAAALHRDGEALSELQRAREALTRQQHALAGCTTTDERMLCAQRTDRAIHDPLARAAVRHGEQGLIAGVEALSDLHELHGQRQPEAVAALTGHGVYISPLERVMVESHSYAFRRNKEIEGIYS
ncbi:nucleoside-diphosphate kinase [Streptomyces sp. NPDC006265]|uniref:nucleoside-diphosphate kinase n=1 Tax=Streptomyces sp. NPDC006265 TaxID=3156740 RepID=UPI0033A8DC95